MGETLLVPKRSRKPATESLGQRSGFSVTLAPAWMVDTSVSEGGWGIDAGAQYELAESFTERFGLGLKFNYASTSGKLDLASNFVEGTTTENTHWGLALSFSKIKRSHAHYDRHDVFDMALNTETKPYIGFGESTIGQPDRDYLGEETLSFGKKVGKTFDIGSETALRGEFQPWGRNGAAFSVGPAFNYGVQYSGEGSEHNRINLSLMFQLSIGYGCGSVRGGPEADRDLGAMGLTQGAFTFGHKLVSRWGMNAAVNDPMDALTDHLGEETLNASNDRGSMVNTPIIQAAPSFMGAMGNDLEVPLRAGPIGYWIFLGAYAAGGAGFLASDGDAGKSAGVSDLFGVGRGLGHAIAGTHTSEKRRHMTDAEVTWREAAINGTMFGLNTVFGLIGAGTGSDVLAAGAFGANTNIALSPAATGRNTIERTDYAYGISGVFGSKRGMRAAVVVHKSMADFPTSKWQFFTESIMSSPQLSLDNMANHPTQDKTYRDAHTNTDIDSVLGMQWVPTPYTRASLGLSTKTVFGGGEDAKNGVGGMFGFDFIIPFNGKESGSGIIFGGRVMAHKLFPKGYQIEPMGMLGFSIGR